MCFYSTQSHILPCGIARFSRVNKNKLRALQPQNLLVLIKKECNQILFALFPKYILKLDFFQRLCKVQEVVLFRYVNVQCSRCFRF